MHVHKEQINHKKTIPASNENESVASVTKDREEKGRGCGWKRVSVRGGHLNIWGDIPPQQSGPLFVAAPSFVFGFKRLLLSNKYFFNFACERISSGAGRTDSSRSVLPHQKKITKEDEKKQSQQVSEAACTDSRKTRDSAG